MTPPASFPADPPTPPAPARLPDLLDWRPTHLAGWLVLNALAGLAYWVFAKIGAWASVGPAMLSVLWFPNGLALALVLAWGPRVIPGLVLGSVAPESMLALTSGMSALNALGLSLLLRVGSVAQWWAIALVLGDWQAALRHSGSRFALRFVVGVLVCCTLAATLGSATLLGFGQMAQQELVPGWLAWWIGDVAGMLVVTPLLLALLHPSARSHVLANQTFPTLSVGLGLTLAGTALLGHMERSARHERAEAESRAFVQSLHSQMDLTEVDLGLLAALHYRINLEQAEFDRQAAALRTAHDWVTGFAYLRLLPHTERAAFEARLDQSIRTITVEGALVRAPDQARYWVVERLNPLGGQEARLAVDEGSDPRRRQALEAALQRNRAAATPIIDNLLFASDDDWGIVLYQPVYEGAKPLSEGARPTGAVAAAVQMRALIQSALSSGPGLEFPTLITTADPSRRGILIEGREVRELGIGDAGHWLRPIPPRDRLQRTLRFGEAEWAVHSQFADSSGWPYPSPSQMVALALGLGCTGLLTALLVLRARRDEVLNRWRHDLAAEVGRRTSELSTVNAQLRQEATEREATSEQLRSNAQRLAEREALLTALLKHIPDPVWMKDLAGRYLIVNPAFAEFNGRPAADLIGRRDQDVHQREALDHIEASDRVAMATREAVKAEVQGVRADGQRVLMAEVRVSVRDEAGRPLGLLGLAWDITEQRHREQALERFRWLADSAAEGFALATPRGRVVYLNATAARWLHDELWTEGAARHVARYFDPEGWLRMSSEVLPTVHAQGHWSGLLPLQDLDGGRHDDLQSSFFLLRDAQGQARYIAMLLTDIRERLQMEEQLAQERDRAEAANRAKTVFLSSMSHEIRTPLNAVLGYAQLLLEDDRLASPAREQVLRIQQAGSRLLRLINDVLDLSKIEAGALQFVPEAVDLRTELAELVNLMQGRARQSSVTVSLEQSLDADLTALLDRGKFGQVVLNVLGNAIKFAPPGGWVRLRASLAEGNQLQLRVEDNGPGIAPSELSKLFQPFQQGAAGLNAGGTGLGLALSRRLVEAMGGALWLEGGANGGTVAHVRLPLTRTQAHPPLPPDEFAGTGWTLATGSRCRVLVAEDDDDSRTLLVGFLTRIGCEVHAGADGAEALALAMEHDFDVVLSDMRMPKLDGLALYRALKDEARCAAWPVVAVTASSLQQDREHFLAQGFADYVAKPYAFQQVLRVLRDYAHARFVRLAPLQTSIRAQGPEMASPVADLQDGLALAREGRAPELRQWLDAATQLPADLTHLVQSAIARYDLQAAEAALQAFINTGKPPS